MVKKIIHCCFVLFLSIVLLSGCRSNNQAAKTQPQNPNTFEADITVNWEDATFKGHLTRGSAGTCSLKFTEPGSLKGMEFILSGDTLKVAYAGLSFAIDPDSIPQASVARTLLNVLDTMVRRDALHATCKNSVWQYAGTCASGDFIVQVDAQSGLITTLDLPALDLNIQFENVVSL